MKIKQHLIQICLLCAGVLLPAVAQAQFSFTTNNGAITITGYTGSDVDVTIPDTINGLRVTCIETNAFEGNPLTSVTITANVTNIGDYAFFFCNNLTAVFFQGNAPCLGIGAFGTLGIPTSPGGPFIIYPNCYYLDGTTGWGSTFGGCPTYLFSTPYFCTPNNASITINGCINAGDVLAIPSTIAGLTVTSIGSSAFAYSSLTSVMIPNSVTTIGDNAFIQCFNLTSLTIPNSVTYIGSDAFQGCSLTNLTLPKSGQLSIGAWAFQGCNDLTSITFPEGVVSIGYYAFGLCAGLTNVTIASSVTSIGQFAFYQDPALTSVNFIGNAAVFDWTTFMDDPAVTIYYLACIAESVGES